MFNIIMQVNYSDKKALDKTITDVITLTGALKEGTSVVDPVIIVTGDILNYIGSNYMTIQEFNRQYFITNIKALRTNVYEISAHVDVLSTYASDIRTNTALLRRQENKWNLYLNDGVFKVYQNPTVNTFPFPSGFSTKEFVLAVAG